MVTDRSPAQHDFSQDPVFVKSKDGHLVRRIGTSVLLAYRSIWIASFPQKNIWGDMKLS